METNDIELGKQLEKINLKVLVSVVSFFALVFLLSSFILGYQYEINSTRSKVKILAENISSSLVFSDKKFAEEILHSLINSPEINFAIIYDIKGEVFASYREELAVQHSNVANMEEQLNMLNLGLASEVTHNEKRIGSVYILVNLERLYNQLLWYLIIILLVSIVALYLGKKLLLRLNQSILSPLFSFIDAITIVSQKNDYNVQVPKSTIKELNLLIDSFNEMLLQINSRDQSLATYRLGLEEQVKIRTSELYLAKEKSENNEQQLVIKNKELINTQAQLIQSAKLASVGEMATGIAHELNQPLGIISMNANLRLNEISKGNFNKVGHSYSKIMDQIKRATVIINHLRSFGRETRDDEFTQEKIQSIINDSFIMFNEQFRLLDIHIVKNIEDDIPPLLCNRIQIEQVIANLLANAKDAVQLAKEKAISVNTQVKGGNIVIEIADSGKGIERSIKDRLFDPFFTTKEVGKGTGLGLSISYGIIKRHKGTLSVHNQPRGGAIFKITLPLLSVNTDDAKA